MLISAAIIVKNEESIIKRCLDCVSLFADEIVVVDTGSTDDTKAIAQQNPKVRLFDSDHFGSWTHFSEFSFSIAKNEAVDKCTGKYIIWWDADDFIDEENAAKIRRIALETEEKCLFTFTVKYGPLTFEHCRMFKSGCNIRFNEDHSVHEYLDTLGYPNHLRRDVEIKHVPGDKSVSSGERNVAIMEKDHYERGMSDPRTLFYLANGYKDMRRHQDAINFYRKYLDVSEWPEERYFARYFLAQSLVEVGNKLEGRDEALRAITEDYRFAESYCLIGDICFSEGDYERAQNWFLLAANTPIPKDAKLFLMQALYNEYPNSRIRDCHDALTGTPVPQKKQTVGGTQFEYTMDVREVMGVFELPPEDNEAIVAASMLAAIAESQRKIFEVVVNHPWIEDVVSSISGLSAADNPEEAQYLILPPNLKGHAREVWYGKAAGYVTNDWEPLVQDARSIASEFRKIAHAN